jgi:hypothetical protein
VIDFDCQACGACCAFDASWPTVESERDRGPEGPPPELVADGVMRCVGDRCIALDGEPGVRVACRIYARRPDTCRICEPGTASCLMARRAFGFPIPEEASTLDGLLEFGARQRLGRREGRTG